MKKNFNKHWNKNVKPMLQTHPQMAAMLLNKEDGLIYAAQSNKKVDWRCLDCHTIIKQKSIVNVFHRGIPCPICSDGKSYPEKVIMALLRVTNKNFEMEKVFNWSKPKRYDFYVNPYNTIIEVHGEHHYKEQRRKKARTLEDELRNDAQKKELALENDISNYIVIDARIPTFEYIKTSILSSSLITLLEEEPDWECIEKISRRSLIVECCELWNSGIHSPLDIANKIHLNRRTVLQYLKEGCQNGLCDYSQAKSRIYGNRKRLKPVMQLAKEDDTCIRIWNNAVEAKDELGIIKITHCCNGKRKTAGGYRWKYMIYPTNT